MYSSENVIVSSYSHFVIFGCSIFAIGWGALQAIQVSATARSLSLLAATRI